MWYQEGRSENATLLLSLFHFYQSLAAFRYSLFSVSCALMTWLSSENILREKKSAVFSYAISLNTMGEQNCYLSNDRNATIGFCLGM